jgi:hypothetical protein
MIKLTNLNIRTQMTRILEIARINTDFISKSVKISDARKAAANCLCHKVPFFRLFNQYNIFK